MIATFLARFLQSFDEALLPIDDDVEQTFETFTRFHRDDEHRSFVGAERD